MALGWLALACQGLAPPEVAPTQPRHKSPIVAHSNRLITLSCLGLNDLHGHVKALPVFAGYVENLRAQRRTDGGHVLLVDAGDMFQGTLESNLNEGRAVVEAYGVMGLDAAALGNHEFDFGPVGAIPAAAAADNPAIDPHGAIKARIAEAPFPMLSANLVEKATRRFVGWDGLRQRALLDLGNIRVGLVGVLTAETPEIVMPAYFQGLDVTPLAGAVEQQARWLRGAGADVVVVLAHAGADCADLSDPYDTSSCRKTEVLKLARDLPEGLVDVIMAGHKHKAIAHFEDGVAIAESYKNGRAFSRVDVSFDVETRSIVQKRIFQPEPLCPERQPCRPGPYAGKPVTPDTRVAEVLAPAIQKAQALKRKQLRPVVGPNFAASGSRESPVGNLFADLMLAAGSADLAITNGGGLRADLPGGRLVYQSLFEAMPFDNYLASFQLSGYELKQVLRRHFSHDRHGIISVAGVRVVARCDPDLVVDINKRDARGDWKPIADNELLTLATSDYLATGGDGLFAPLHLDSSKIRFDTSMLLRDVLAAQIDRYETISADQFYDLKTPRLDLERPRPITCKTGTGSSQLTSSNP